MAARCDRLPTKEVAVIAALINTVLVGAIAVMLFLDTFHLNVAIGIAALFGLLEAFLYPAILALLPQLISKPRLGQANAWMQGSEQITNVIGSAAAGIVIGTFGLPLSFTINTVLSAVGSGCIYLMKTPLVLLAYSLGVGLVLLGWVQQSWVAAVIIALMGVGGGIVGVLGLTWLQQQTATQMQGRMMSLVMFAAIALDPFSQAISGVFLEISLTGLFVAAGGMMLITAVVVSLEQAGDRSV